MTHQRFSSNGGSFVKIVITSDFARFFPSQLDLVPWRRVGCVIMSDARGGAKKVGLVRDFERREQLPSGKRGSVSDGFSTLSRKRDCMLDFGIVRRTTFDIGLKSVQA